jgi:transcription elongation factor S-II
LHGQAEEEIWDMLQALTKVQMTEELLRESKIGVIVYETKKKFAADNRVHVEAKNLIAAWKKVVKPADPAAKPAAKPGAATTTTSSSSVVTVSASSSSQSSSGRAEAKSETKTSTTTTEAAEDDDNADGTNEWYDGLSGARKKIVDVLSEQLKQSASNDSHARFLGCQIEDAVNKIFNAEKDKKAYTDKARSLLFNLKRNDRLREDVVSGLCEPDVLATLTPEQMATDEQQKLRENAMKSSVMERRSDYYQVNRDNILRANGINPNIGGEFVCSRCKGNKTTHYAMQTRSADEPMTVFVSCLTCGKRWRTQ